MTTVDLPLLLTSVTALAAVIGPVVSTCITIRSTERLRREELRAPKVYAAISQLINAFHGLHRQNDRVSHSGWDLEQHNKHIREAYTTFSVACFEVMSLMNNEEIRDNLSALLDWICSSNFYVSAEHECTFHQVIADIALELSDKSSKHNHPVSRKGKSRRAKNNRR